MGSYKPDYRSPSPDEARTEYDVGPLPVQPDDGLAPSTVRYLSFKGGGGKGWAFLGVLVAMTHDKVRLMVPAKGGSYRVNSKVAGVSGTSAGGLIAGLLASGFTLQELFDIVYRDTKKPPLDLVKFFDPPSLSAGKSYVPVVSTAPFQVSRRKAKRDGTFAPESTETLRGAGYYETESKKDEFPISTDNRYYIPGTSNYDVFKKGLRYLVEVSMHERPGTFGDDNWDAHLQNLVRDGGLCSGVYVRSYVAKLLKRKLGDPAETFGNHQGREGLPALCLVGSDVSPGRKRMVYFSGDSTPNLKIADAMRITMSFPGVFKPVVVGDEPFAWGKAEKLLPGKLNPQPDSGTSFDPTGIWVDGGVSNQLPIHAFDERTVPLNATGSGSANVNDAAVAFDLVNHRPDGVDSGLGVLGEVVGGLTEIAATDREFRTETEQRHRVAVPARPLSTLNFTPTNKHLAMATIAAAAATFDYFGVEPTDLLRFVHDRTPFSAKEIAVAKNWLAGSMSESAN